jgi:hypothetical protein
VFAGIADAFKAAFLREFEAAKKKRAEDFSPALFGR